MNRTGPPGRRPERTSRRRKIRLDPVTLRQSKGRCHQAKCERSVVMVARTAIRPRDARSDVVRPAGVTTEASA
jgi:hypothetical protein